MARDADEQMQARRRRLARGACVSRPLAFVWRPTFGGRGRVTRAPRASPARLPVPQLAAAQLISTLTATRGLASTW
jgi:hypothetical protein